MAGMDLMMRLIFQRNHMMKRKKKKPKFPDGNYWVLSHPETVDGNWSVQLFLDEDEAWEELRKYIDAMTKAAFPALSHDFSTIPIILPGVVKGNTLTLDLLSESGEMVPTTINFDSQKEN
jgi:hypothetical protein